MTVHCDMLVDVAMTRAQQDSVQAVSRPEGITGKEPL
jgi:hypothetical protein